MSGERGAFDGILKYVSSVRVLTHSLVAATLHGVFDFVLFCLHYALAGEGSALDDLRVIICAASGLLILCLGLFCYVAIASRADRAGKERDETVVPLMEEGRARDLEGDLVVREEEEDQRIR